MANGISMFFNGSTSRLSNTTAPSIGSSASILIRFKCTTTSGTQTLVNAIQDTNNRLVLNITSGAICGGFFNGSTFTSKSSDITLVKDKFYTAVLTWDGTNTVLYVNGLAQNGSTNPTSTSTAGVYIGAKSDSTEFFSGIIDVVKIWSRTLSSTEAITVSNNGAVRPNGLIREYLFTEGFGTSTTADSSGNGANLTITGAIYSSNSAVKSRTAILPSNTFGTIGLVGGTKQWVSACRDVMFARSSTSDTTLRRSYDNGVTWQDVFNFNTVDSNTLVQFCVRLNTGTLIATAGTASYDATPGRIYRSTNNGVSWTLVQSLSAGEGIYWSLTYSGTNIFCGEYGQYPARDIYRSQDDGQTWSIIWTNPSSASVHTHGVIANPYNPSQMLFVTGDSSQGTYFSNDGGTTITQIISSSSLQMTYGLFKPPYIFLATDNGTGDLYRDTIANFVANTPSLVKVFDGDTNAFGNYIGQVYTISQDSQGRIYLFEFDETNASFGNGGTFVSCDDGNTWTQIEDYPKQVSAGVGVGAQQSNSALWTNKIYSFLGSSNGTDLITINPLFRT